MPSELAGAEVGDPPVCFRKGQDDAFRRCRRHFDPHGVPVAAAALDLDLQLCGQGMQHLESDEIAELAEEMNIDEQCLGLVRKYPKVDHAAPVEMLAQARGQPARQLARGQSLHAASRSKGIAGNAMRKDRADFAWQTRRPDHFFIERCKFITRPARGPSRSMSVHAIATFVGDVVPSLRTGGETEARR